MNIAMLINFVCIVLIVVMGLQIFKLSKRNKKNKKKKLLIDDLGVDLVKLLEHDPSILQQVKDHDIRDNLLQLVHNLQYEIKNLSNEELLLKYPDLHDENA